jgi:hypothetical protein
LDPKLADVEGAITIIVNVAVSGTRPPQELISHEPKYTWSEVVKKFL